MAILYPNQIANVYVQGVEFTGNMVSVGNDAFYSYDYDHPWTAFQAESAGTLFLIYPGTYDMSYWDSTYHHEFSNKNFTFRGMGDSPVDVRFAQANNQSTFMISGSFTKVIAENIYASEASSPSVLSIKDGTVATELYVNKSYFYMYTPFTLSLIHISEPTRPY